MSVSYWQAQTDARRVDYDVIIVGAGLTGLSCAYWLRKKQADLKILVIDKGSLGAGASSRNAGFVTCGSVEHFNRQAKTLGLKTARKLWEFSEENLALLKEEILNKPICHSIQARSSTPLDIQLSNQMTTLNNQLTTQLSSQAQNDAGYKQILTTQPSQSGQNKSSKKAHLTTLSSQNTMTTSGNEASPTAEQSLENGMMLGSDFTQFRQNGTFSLASSASELAELEETARLMRQSGIEAERISSAEIAKRIGAVGFSGGIKYLNDAEIHPQRLLELIAAHSESDFSLHNEVYKITNAGAQKKLKTQQGEFYCDALVLATNAYSPLLDPYFSDKVFPTRGQILVTEPAPYFLEAPCYAHFVLDYFRQLPDGRVLIGGFRQLEKETEVGYSDHTTEKIQRALEEFLRKHFPSLSSSRIDYRWSGVMGFSVDGQPMIGALPHDPQTFFAVGMTAHGLGLAFHSAKTLVDAMYGAPLTDLFSAQRFSQG